MTIVVEIEETYNPNSRNFGLSKIISYGQWVFIDTSSDYAKKGLAHVSKQAKNLVEDLFSTGAIFSILIMPEIICIEKKDAAEWSQIEKRLMASLKQSFGNSRFSFWTWIDQKIES